MISTPDPKSAAVFDAASIKAMSPLGQEIAAMLEQAGYITIIKAPAQKVST